MIKFQETLIPVHCSHKYKIKATFICLCPAGRLMTLYKKTFATTTIIVTDIILMTTSFMTTKKCEKGKDSCVCCATLMGVHVGLRKVVLVSPFMVQTGSCFTGRLGNTVTLQFVFVAMLVFELVRTKGGGSTTA